MQGVRAPKQIWKLGDGEELLPDGSVLCPGSRRQDGSFRKATRRKKGYYNDEDLQRNVYKPNAVRLREQGLHHVVGLGMIQNSVGKGKKVAESKKEEKRRRAKRKRNLKHTLLHLVRPFCVENQQPERFFAFRVVENMCKSLDIPAIEALAKQDWQTQLFDNFEKAVAEMERTKFETRQKQALKYHHGLLHDIDCWKIRQQGGVELNDFWIQDLKNRAQFEKELKYFQNLKGKPIVKKNSSGVAAAAEEEVEAKDGESNDQSAPAEDPKKTLKKLRKRLRQIKKLEEKLQNGETLNDDQQKKLGSKQQIEDSITNLESKV